MDEEAGCSRDDLFEDGGLRVASLSDGIIVGLDGFSPLGRLDVSLAGGCNGLPDEQALVETGSRLSNRFHLDPDYPYASCSTDVGDWDGLQGFNRFRF